MFACILADSLKHLLLMSTAISVARNHDNTVLEKKNLKKRLAFIFKCNYPFCFLPSHFHGLDYYFIH